MDRSRRRLAPLVGMPSVQEGPTTVLPRLDAETMARLDADVEAGQDPIVSFSPDTVRLHVPRTDTAQLRAVRPHPRHGARHAAPAPAPAPRAAPTVAPSEPVAPVAVPSQYRPELQGLRAVAALAVVVYHVWVGRVSGGVDVFFVITGFLATGQLVRACEKGTVDVVAYWGRTLRRLTPPMALVLLATVATAMVVLPESRWLQTIHEVVASALFVENWRLAADSVDYYAAHDTASVVQHFWSLSIQVQFTLVFPVLVVLAAVVAHRRGRSVRDGALVLLAGVTAASFVYSVVLTATDQQLAYFHSLTRVWEFTAGGLLALVAGNPVGRPVLRWVLGWAGVAGLLACGIVLDVAGGFPGYLALWPVLSACAVLAAGTTGLGLSADRLLTSAPLRYLGDISFPLYLWHWPVLLFALLLTDRTDPGLELGLLLIVLSLVLAAGTHHLVETPLRSWSPVTSARWSGHAVVAIVLVPVLGLTAAWSATAAARAQVDGAVGDPDHPGAAALAPGFVYRGAPGATLLPPAVEADRQWVEYENGCTRPAARPNLEICTWVPTAGPPAKTIVVAGDSHIQQFLPALTPVARANNWRVLTMIRPGCPFSTSSDANLGEVPCLEWNAAAIAEIEATRPDAVVAGASRNVRVGLTEETPPGFVEAWRRLERAGVPVMAVRDNIRYGYEPAECIEQNGPDAPRCDVPRSAVYSPDPPYRRAGAPGTVTLFDLADQLCDPRRCPPAIGNTVVNLDNNHLTAAYAASMAPEVGATLEDVVDK